MKCHLNNFYENDFIKKKKKNQKEEIVHLQELWNLCVVKPHYLV